MSLSTIPDPAAAHPHRAYMSRNPALANEWATYFAAMAEGDLDGMCRAQSRIERLTLAVVSRRDTVRSLRAAAIYLPK